MSVPESVSVTREGDAGLRLVKTGSHDRLQVWGQNQLHLTASRIAREKCSPQETRVFLPGEIDAGQAKARYVFYLL